MRRVNDQSQARGGRESCRRVRDQSREARATATTNGSSGPRTQSAALVNDVSTHIANEIVDPVIADLKEDNTRLRERVANLESDHDSYRELVMELIHTLELQTKERTRVNDRYRRLRDHVVAEAQRRREQTCGEGETAARLPRASRSNNEAEGKGRR